MPINSDMECNVSLAYLLCEFHFFMEKQYFILFFRFTHLIIS
jgi:hypothetical protein